MFQNKIDLILKWSDEPQLTSSLIDQKFDIPLDTPQEVLSKEAIFFKNGLQQVRSYFDQSIADR